MRKNGGLVVDSKLPPVLAGREEELERLAEARGPGIFVVFAASDDEVSEGFALAVSLAFEATRKDIAVAYVAGTFRRADVEPEFGAGRWRTRTADGAEDGAVVPPDAG